MNVVFQGAIPVMKLHSREYSRPNAPWIFTIPIGHLLDRLAARLLHHFMAERLVCNMRLKEPKYALKIIYIIGGPVYFI